MKVTRGKGTPKLRSQILTRQTRSLKSGTLTTDELVDTMVSAPVATQTEDGSVSIVWTPEAEIILFKEMIDYKLVGPCAHFNVIAVTKLLSKAFGFRVNPEAVWQHVNKFFDTKRLESTAPKIEQSDFTLPRSFNVLISERATKGAEKRKEVVKSTGSPTVGNSSTEKPDKEGGTPNKESFVQPSPTSSESTKEVKKLNSTSNKELGHKNRLSSSTPSSSSSTKDKGMRDTNKVTPNVKKDLRFKVNKDRDAKVREKDKQHNSAKSTPKERDSKLMLKRAATTPAFNVSKKRRI